MTFPVVAQDIEIEFFINGAWVDVTNLRPTHNCYVLGLSGSADDNPAVTIRRLKKSGLPIFTNSVEFTFFDPDAVMDTENPYSPFYEDIPPGTNVRILVDGSQKMICVVDSVTPDMSNGPGTTTVTFTCVGVWEPLALGDRPLSSPITRSTTRANPVDYWRMEEGSGSSTFRSANGGRDALVTGAVTFATDSELGGSLPLPRMGSDGLVQMPVRDFTPSGHWQIDFFVHMEGERTVDTTMFRVLLSGASHTGTTMYYMDWIVGNNTQRIRGYDPAGNTLFSSGLFTTPNYLVSGWSHCRLMLEDAGGGTVNWAFVEFPVPIATGNFFSGSFTGTIGKPIMLQMISPLYQPAGPTATLDGTAYGHYAVYDAYNFSAVDDSGDGFLGEEAWARFVRICTEEGIPFASAGSVEDSMPMGPQPAASTTDILIQIAVADGGIIYDSKNTLALVFKPRLNLYAQSPTLSLEYTGSHLSPPLTPVTGGVSDTTIQNDITAERPNGGSARYVISDDDLDHWTTQDPPDGVTTREGKVTVNVSSDDYLDQIAAWTAHLAAWKERRFSELTVERHRAAIAADPALSQAVWDVDIMGLIALDTTGGSRWLPQPDARMLMESRVDTLAQFGHRTVFTTRPADPYEVITVNTSGSNLANTLTTSSTSLKVATTSGPEWSEVDEPYHVQMNGEAMRVTAVTTDTPAFIAAGAVAHANNASVVPGLPAGMTVDVGQLLLLYAAIRNSGTGTVNTPSGWTLITSNGNTAIFGRYYRTGDTAPTVSFTGGVAGADTSAIITGWSGLSLNRGGSNTGPNGTNGKTPASSHNQNGSQQNIDYTQHYVFRDKTMVMVFGWKQDDWTSVATLAGFTEAYEASTTLGDDQGIVMDYKLQTPAADLAAGSFTVTGGVSAIGRSTVIALRPLQTFTVVRGVNNVNITHSIGETVRTWRMGINGL